MYFPSRVSLRFIVLLFCSACFSGILSMKCTGTLMVQRLVNSVQDPASPPCSILLQTFSCWQKVTTSCAPSLLMYAKQCYWTLSITRCTYRTSQIKTFMTCCTQGGAEAFVENIYSLEVNRQHVSKLGQSQWKCQCQPALSSLTTRNACLAPILFTILTSVYNHVYISVIQNGGAPSFFVYEA